ncbi:hypothetical protein BDV06DRAFT_224425 [Aspergillus oleicola]
MSTQTQPVPEPLPDRISHSQLVLTITTAVMVVLSTIFVFLRLASRTLSKVGIGLDDLACVGSLIFSYANFISTVVAAVVARAGYHVWQYDVFQLGKYLQVVLANSILYTSSISLAKISILLFYNRIFTISRAFHIATYIVGTFVMASWISSLAGLIFATNPVQAQWQVWIPHTSIDSYPFYMTMGVANIVLDVSVLCLPQPIVWKLQMGRRRKVLVSLVFFMGGFVCITSAMRLYSITTVDLNDATYTYFPTALWSMLEMDVGIICTCLPTLPHLVRYYRARAQKRIGSSRTGSDSVQPIFDVKPLSTDPSFRALVSSRDSYSRWGVNVSVESSSSHTLT